jgi:thiamine-phosphate pyrophosphorylase
MLRLMAITDGVRDGIDALTARVAAAVRGGATCVQIRLKGESARLVAAATRAIVAAVPVPVLVNDRFDIALAASAAGVHVGADDIAVDDVRRITPPGFVIGTSVGADQEIANAAAADFVGIGPVYPTGSKDDAGTAIGVAEFARLATLTGKPAVGIGGVTSETAAAILRAGGAGVAVIGAIFGSADCMASARTLLRALSDADVGKRATGRGTARDGDVPNARRHPRDEPR